MSLSQLFAETERFLAHVPRCHGWEHAIAVARNATTACLEEDVTLVQTECIIAAAVLHDVDDRKFFPHSVAFANAQTLLHLAGYRGAEFALIIEMIGYVSASSAGNSVVQPRWKLIPRDADRVEALGQIGIERCHAYTRAQNRPIALECTPCPVTDAELDMIDVGARFQRYVESGGHSQSMIDHFYDKLFALRFESRNGHLVSVARERMQIMREWLYRINTVRRVRGLAMQELPEDF